MDQKEEDTLPVGQPAEQPEVEANDLPLGEQPSKPPNYPKFKPIDYSDVVKEEAEDFEVPFAKKREMIILESEKPKSKMGVLIIVLLLIVILMLGIYVYLAYFRSEKIKVGENIDSFLIEDNIIYLTLSPIDFENTEKIDFFLVDSEENEHVYTTYHLRQDHEIYPQDVGLSNFDDLKMIYVEFETLTLSPPVNQTQISPLCGNNVINPGEICDKGNVGGKVCDDFFKYGDGQLSCCYECDNFDLRGCRNITYTACSDSDAGIDHSSYGSVSVEFRYRNGPDCSGQLSNVEGSGGSYYQDRCSGDVLVEYYCNSDNSVTKSEHDCSSEGKVCEFGACEEPMFSSLNVWDSIGRLLRKISDKL